MHSYVLSTSDPFRLYLQLVISRNNQKTSFGTGVLDGSSHEPVDEFFEHYLAGKCLRGFNHCCEVEIFDRRFDRTSRTRRTLVLPQPRMEPIELSHLSICSPSQVGVSCVLQVEMRKLLKATSGVKAGCQLIGEAFDVHESVGARRTDRPFVEALRVEVPIFDSGYLGADDCGAAFKILRAVSYPFLELSVAGAQCRHVLLEVIR